MDNRNVAFWLTIVTYVSFIWAIRFHFERPGHLHKGMRLIAWAGSICMLAHLTALAFAPAVDAGMGWAGVAFLAGSLGLFWWSVRINRKAPLTIAFSKNHPTHLVEAGPYAWVRHPFYVSYSMAWVGGWLATGQGALVLCLFCMGFLYFKAAQLEEQKFAVSSMAADYAAYKARVGMFFPKLSSTTSRPAARRG